MGIDGIKFFGKIAIFLFIAVFMTQSSLCATPQKHTAYREALARQKAFLKDWPPERRWKEQDRYRKLSWQQSRAVMATMGLKKGQSYGRYQQYYMEYNQTRPVQATRRTTISSPGHSSSPSHPHSSRKQQSNPTFQKLSSNTTDQTTAKKSRRAVAGFQSHSAI